MSYAMGNTGIRSSEWDLGLSPREEFRLGYEFGDALRGICGRSVSKSGIWQEVSQAARQRAGLGAASEYSITIPTHAAIWPVSQVDQRSRLKWAQRAAAPMVTSTDNIGGYLRATDQISFIEMLRNRSVLFNMGARRLSGLVGNITIPKQTAGATANWLSTETTAITVSQQTLAQVPLTPRTVGALTQISRLLQLQSSPEINGLVMSDLAQQITLAVDLAGLAGTGSEQPTGIIGTANVGAFTGTNLDAVALINAQTDVATADALTRTCGYVFTPAVAALLMARPELPTTGTTRVWQGNIMEGTIFGFRAMSSAQMPTAKAIFGDWSQCIIGEWGVLELAVNPNEVFAQGVIGIRAMYTVDVAVRYAGAFSVASSIT